VPGALKAGLTQRIRHLGPVLLHHLAGCFAAQGIIRKLPGLGEEFGGVASQMANHTPIVTERTDWRITKAASSCGNELNLGSDVGFPKEQFEKLEAAFLDHKKARGVAFTKGARPKAAPKKTTR
jgi:hypothetical protein